MRVQDFEISIDDLCVKGLVIDEMKMKVNSGGQVYQVNGHTKTQVIVWDELGRAFTMPKKRKSEEFIELGSGKSVRGRRLERDREFDLKFE